MMSTPHNPTMGFTQTCLRAPSAILQQETNLAATGRNREARLLAAPLCRVKKSMSDRSDSSFGGCAQNVGNLAFSRRRRAEIKLENLQAQCASSSYFSSRSLESCKPPASSTSTNLVSPNSKRQTTSCNSGSRSISSPSPGSPRFDSEEGSEFQEKAKRGRDVFQEFQGKFQEQDGDEESHLGRNDMARSASGAADLFNQVESENGSDDKGEEDGNSSAGYESWGEESDTSTQSSGSASVVSVADSLAIGGKEPVYQGAEANNLWVLVGSFVSLPTNPLPVPQSNYKQNWSQRKQTTAINVCKKPVEIVLEVHPTGEVAQREVSRRQLLRSTAGLRLRDIRSVDPSLWVTNSVPAILIRDQAILFNLGSLRAIATSQSVLIFEQKRVGAQAFMESLLPRLRTASNGHGPIMPFELEVLEAALLSRTQRLEQMLMDVEPRVVSLLKVLPNRYTADVLEELRLGKQALVELAAKAGALRQMLLELLDHPQDIRKMTIMGRTCNIRKADGSIECTVPLDKQSAEDEEQEIEMLLEYYLQRCDSCHGQANKLLDSAKEMEDSIGVNLSSRRLEVSRLELLLQVGTFCSALGALVAGIFGMNLKSYLEEHVMAFYFTTAGIILGGIALFFAMFSYLQKRKIL